MKVALVHDYLREAGGAEKVLKAFADIFPEAPIYTAFCVNGSTAAKQFQGKRIQESFLAPILKIDNFYSPLRFLAPLIWKSFDLTGYDLVIASSSWYITRGFKVGPQTIVVCYCHTPPRWLYGYETSVGFTKYWPVKIYAMVVGHLLRLFDFTSSQKIKWWIANSKNVQQRISKFYRKESTVIYPPVEVEEIIRETSRIHAKENYFLIVSRLVGAKGIEEAVRAFQSKSLADYKLKIVGEGFGYSNLQSRITDNKSSNIEILGRVSDQQLYKLYAQAQGFIALARDEDFGMTVVEAQAAGTPVIAFNGGGFKESVLNGITGILIDNTDQKTIASAVNRLNRIKWNRQQLQDNARRFSKGTFVREIKNYINNHARTP